MFPNLNAEIARSGITKKELAKVIGIASNDFYLRLSGKREFKRSECSRICKLLNNKFEYLFQVEGE